MEEILFWAFTTLDFSNPIYGPIPSGNIFLIQQPSLAPYKQFLYIPQCFITIFMINLVPDYKIFQLVMLFESCIDPKLDAVFD